MLNIHLVFFAPMAIVAHLRFFLLALFPAYVNNHRLLPSVHRFVVLSRQMSSPPAAAAAAASNAATYLSIPSISTTDTVTLVVGCAATPAQIAAAPVAKTKLVSIDVVPPGKPLKTVHSAVVVDEDGHKLAGGAETELFFRSKGNVYTFWNVYGTAILEFPVPLPPKDGDTWDGKTFVDAHLFVPFETEGSSNVDLLTDVQQQYVFLSSVMNNKTTEQRARFLSTAREFVREHSSADWMLPDERLKVRTAVTFANRIRTFDAGALLLFSGGTYAHAVRESMKLPDQPTKFAVTVQVYADAQPRTLTVTTRWPWAVQCKDYFRRLVGSAIKCDPARFQFLEIQCVS